MARTSYYSYKWLIETLEKAPKDGYQLETIAKMYFAERRERERRHYRRNDYTLTGVSELKRSTFYHWRVQIWQQFGLTIDAPRFDNYFVLTNPELLDQNRTLRSLIEHLVSEEERGFQKGTLVFSKRGRKPKAMATGSTMGFMSFGEDGYIGQMGYDEMDEPEMVGIIQFAMAIGESLVIEYSKIEISTSKRTEKYVLEPHQLKEINGRWYVAGNLYPYDDKEQEQLSIYDVERIRLCQDEDVIAPRYEVKKGFEIEELIPNTWKLYFETNKVVSLYIRAGGAVIDKKPFCQAQMKIESECGLIHYIYKVYVKPDKDFFIQYLAYGDELRVFNPHSRIERTDTDITDEQISYMNRLRKEKWHI